MALLPVVLQAHPAPQVHQAPALLQAQAAVHRLPVETAAHQPIQRERLIR